MGEAMVLRGWTDQMSRRGGGLPRQGLLCWGLLSLALALTACSKGEAPAGKAPQKAPQKAADAQVPVVPGAKATAGEAEAAGGQAPEAVAQRPAAPKAPTDGVIAAAFKHPPGVEECEDCHPDIVASYQTTGMGRSMYRPDGAEIIEDFSPKAATIRHSHTGLEYQAYRDEDGTWWQEERLPGTDYSRKVKVDYIIGSGNHTRSYLGEVGGQIIELPLTWYAHRKIWDMSPGYQFEKTLRFTRWVRPECLFCHNDASPALKGAPAAYAGELASGITCTRCHGDGAAHIKARYDGVEPPAGQRDATIVNPKYLSADHQLQICQQCHLQGAARVLTSDKTWHEYRPDVPLEDFMSIFEEARAGGGAFSIASHGHRMSLSACAKGSAAQGKRLVCTTCHDPHRPASTASHRAACLSCHTPKDCGEAHTAADPEASCAGCHMRKGGTSDIPHVHFTDHFIRKRPTADEAPPASDGQLADALSPDKRGEQDPLILGLAYGQGWKVLNKKENRRWALPLLQKAYAAGRYTFDSLHLLALMSFEGEPFFKQMAAMEDEVYWPHPFWRLDWADRLLRRGALDEAIAALKPALALPNATAFIWRRYGDVLNSARRFDEAEAAYAKAETIDPYEPLLAQSRATNAMHAGRMEDARRWLEAAVERDGMNVNVRAWLGEVLIEGQNAERLLKLAKEVEAVAPEDPRWRILKAAGLRQQGKAKAALKILDEVGQRGRQGRYWLAVARARRDSGDRAGAAEAAAMGLRFEPGNPALRAITGR